MACAFFIWAPWSSAITIADAEIKYGQKFPPEWNAVVVNHGQFRNEPWGTTNDHPVGYVVLSCFVFVPPLVILIVGVREGLRRKVVNEFSEKNV
jgi:hypothetical protein